MKRLFVSAFAIQLLAYVGVASAYDIQTHRELSAQAVEKSVLRTDSSVLANLGLKLLSEDELFPNSKGLERTIKDLVRDGAEFEDDAPRFFHHFYDPVYDRSLTIGGVPLGYKSPDWALEDQGEIGGQDNSFRGARRWLFYALTLEDKIQREQFFGLMFQTLGQVIHHLQDMAQPQHVRNEEHLFPRSLYEQTSTEREVLDQIKGGAFFSYPRVSFDTARKFWVAGAGQGIAEFTNRNFVSARRNFTGSLEHIEPYPEYPLPNGEGATIEVREVGDPELGKLALPVQASFLDLDSTPLDGKLFFVGTPITDGYYSFLSGFNDRTSTFSLYDEDLNRYNVELSYTGAGIHTYRTRALFTLNRFNYEKAREFLLPCAIAYSAGLIDYFFRGDLSMCDSEQTGEFIIKNLSPTEDMKGTFALYYDDEQDIRHGIVEWKSADQLPPEKNGVLERHGGEMHVPTFTPPPDPKAYVLVFHGDMGEEKELTDDQGNVTSYGAVVAKVLDPDRHCRDTLWVWNGFSPVLTTYDFPSESPGGSVGPAVSGEGSGVAYDPRDGNLWYTVLDPQDPLASDGKIHKMTPDGTPLPEEITVVGTDRRTNGTYQTDFSALDVDPDDPAYLWVAGAFSPIRGNSYSVYKVDTRTGVVVQTCRVGEPDTGPYSGANLVLAATKRGDLTVLLVSPSLGGFPHPLQEIDVFANGCGPLASYNIFPDPARNENGAVLGLDTSGGDVIAAVVTTDGNTAFYNLGGPPYIEVKDSFPVPDSFVGDIAIGSSF